MIPGVWLGAGVSVDLLVIQNFSAIDRFIGAPLSRRSIGPNICSRLALPSSALATRSYLSDAYHGFYPGSEILKLLPGVGLAPRLTIRRERSATRHEPATDQNG
jgi:hypothetical protein